MNKNNLMTVADFRIMKNNKFRQGHPINLTGKLALAMLGICLLYLSAFAGSNEEKPTADVTRYDKTIGDTRVVLLAISSVNVLTSTNSENNETNTTYLELSFLNEYVGTNYLAPAVGSVILYLQNKDGQESPLNADSVMNINVPGSVDKDLPIVNTTVTDAKKCYIRHVFLHGLNYPSGAQATCVFKSGFNGSLADFQFNILLPRSSNNNNNKEK
jgi:hypothetical protein